MPIMRNAGQVARPVVLNPTLYALLKLRYGSVHITNEGLGAVFGTPQWSPERQRLESTTLSGGEEYSTNCPYCTDQRHRLAFNHLWGVPDPLNGQPMIHKVHCFNEECERGRYGALADFILGPISDAERKAIAALDVTAIADFDADDQPLLPVPLPGTIISLTDLKADHPANVYLRGRRLDPEQLVREWGVGFCVRAEGQYYGIARRIFIPVFYRGDLVGWQGRWPGDDYEAQRTPKYYNMSGFKKSRVLYGHDRAMTLPHVILVEGASDVWKTGPGAVALFGKTVSFFQKRLLEHWSNAGGLLVLMLDPTAWTTERSNPECAAVDHVRLVDELKRQFDDRFVEITLPDGKDPGSIARATLRKIIKQEVKLAGFTPARFGF